MDSRKLTEAQMLEFRILSEATKKDARCIGFISEEFLENKDFSGIAVAVSRINDGLYPNYSQNQYVYSLHIATTDKKPLIYLKNNLKEKTKEQYTKPLLPGETLSEQNDGEGSERYLVLRYEHPAVRKIKAQCFSDDVKPVAAAGDGSAYSLSDGKDCKKVVERLIGAGIFPKNAWEMLGLDPKPSLQAKLASSRTPSPPPSANSTEELVDEGKKITLR